MPTISVSIPHDLEIFINDMVKSGLAPNKSEVVRQALIRFAEDQAVEAVLRSEQEIKEGKILKSSQYSLLPLQ